MTSPTGSRTADASTTQQQKGTTMSTPKKYIDLEDRVFDEVANNSRTQCRRVLAWLDDHPDQVPGRTITESKVTEAFGPEYMAWARMCLSRIGVTVVPDPEPTNVEKLAKEILDSFNKCEFDLEESFGQLAKALDARGVEAPGGGNE